MGNEHAKKVQEIQRDHKTALSTKDAQIKAFAEQCKRYVALSVR